jgi:tankyrase
MKSILTLLACLFSQVIFAGTQMDKFFEAAQYGDIKTIKELLTKNPGLITSKDEYGFNALHLAATEDNEEMISYLVSSGLDINTQNDEGIAPLHIASYPEIAELFIQLGANIELEDYSGNTPLLIHSTEPESFEVMEVLLNHGANYKHKNKSGKTARDYAKSRNEFDKVELLDGY